MVKFADYSEFGLSLSEKAAKKMIPLKAMFELTYRCNLRCRHCYIVNKSNRKELSTSQVFAILDQLESAGTLNLGITGGEVFLRKDIFDILRYAKGKGFNIIVFTNATLITPSEADKIKEIGLNKIDISFNSIDERVFEWFVRAAPGTYKKILRAIRLLRDRSIPVYLKTIAMTINKDDLLKMRRIAVERYGAHFRYGFIVTPAWGGNKENLRFRLSPEEIIQIGNQISLEKELEIEKLGPLERERVKPKRIKIRQPRINHNQLFRCGAGRTEVIINPFGEMRLCMDIPFPKYNILNGSFDRGWRVLKDYVKNTFSGLNYQCNNCKLARYCVSCPAVGYLECADMNACAPSYRQLASLNRDMAKKKGTAG